MSGSKWQDVDSWHEDDISEFTERLPIPCGWLYRVIICRNQENDTRPVAVGVTFVPDGLKQKQRDKFDAYDRMLVFALARLKLHDPEWDEVCRFTNVQLNDVGLSVEYADVERVLGKQKE